MEVADATLPPKQLSGIHLIGVVAALSIAAFMIPVDITVANVAIPDICGDMGTEPSQGKSIVTTYYIGEAIGIPLTAWLTKKLGDIRLFLFTVLLFVLFSFFCASSFTLPMLIFFRFLQGLASGPILPLTQSLLIKYVPHELFMVVYAIANMFFMSGTMFGPFLGGLITSYLGWPWIFYINIPLGLLVIFIIWYELRACNTPPKIERFDWIGLMLVSICVISLQIVLDHGQEFDWWNSPIIRNLFFATIISAVLIFFYETSRKSPFLELRFFKKPTFALSSVLMWFAISIDLSTMIIFSLWLQLYKDYDPFWAGLSTAPFGVGTIAFAALSPILMKHLKPIGMAAFGSVIAAISCFYQSAVQTPDIDFFNLVIPRFFLGGGVILNFIALSLMCKQEVEQKDLTGAFANFQFFRSLMSAVGIALLVTFWQRSTIHQHENVVASAITSHADNYIGLLEKQGLSSFQALEIFNKTVDLQASTIAFNNYLYAMGWLFLFMVGLCLFGIKQRGEVDISKIGFD